MAEESHHGARSLSDLCAALVDAYARQDRAGIESLYLPSARVMAAEGEAPALGPAEAIEDRLRLGLPIAVAIRDVAQLGWRAEVRLDWAVIGTTPDGTEMAMSGSGTLECEERRGVWFVVAERPARR